VKQILTSAAIAAAGIVVALAATPQAEARIGVTGAVVPQADALRPGNPLEPLVLGADVDFNEHIVTTENGHAQILFLDRSTLTVGPNADVVIDKFVYSPQDDSGSLAISATKGILRYVGGALSKNEDAVKIETPTAIIGIRGGIALVEVEASGATHATFLYGKELTITGLNGIPVHVTRPGFTTSVAVGGLAPSVPVKANPVQIAATIATAAPANPVQTAAAATISPAPPAAAPANAPAHATSAPAPAPAPAVVKAAVPIPNIAPAPAILSPSPILPVAVPTKTPAPIAKPVVIPPKAVVTPVVKK
jgi:hypothetical protein